MSSARNDEQPETVRRKFVFPYRWLPRSLEGQLILFTTMSLVVAILGFAAYIASRQSLTENQTMALQMSALARNLAEVSDDFIVTGNLNGIEDLASKTANFPSVLSILVVDATGKPVSEVVNRNGLITPQYSKEMISLPAGTRPLVQGESEDEEKAFAGWHLLLVPHQQDSAWHPVMGGRVLGWVRVTYSLAKQRENIMTAWRDAMLFSGLAIAIALSLLVILLKAPMRALKSATRFANDLDVQLGKQMPVLSTSVEIEALGIALNSASARLQHQEGILQEMAGFTHRIVDSVVDGIVTIDGQGIIQTFNQSASTIFGYTASEVVGQNVRMLMPEPYRSAHDTYLANYRATGVGKIIGNGREVEGCRKDGSTFPMDLAVSLSAHEGQPLFIGLVRDITERKRMERMKAEFVSTVSHELRTPLTSISGALGLVTGGALGAIPDQAKQMLDIAHKNSLRLALLINDLLDMEKLAAGRMPFEMRVESLMPLLEHSLETVRAYGEQYQVRFELVARAEDVNVLVDGIRLQQVMSNLLSNAAKFSPPGAQVEISAHRNGERVRINVIDHGQGISEEFRTRIFQKFSQADSSDTRQKGGTGLGLVISKEIIEHMHGSIGFDSEEGQGTCFYFELPVYEADQ
ncbi:MAG: ATP-binding protein [Sterolibacterium sp.]